MDLATEFGEQGFRWLFVIHAHGSPNHNRGPGAGGRLLPRHLRRSHGESDRTAARAQRGGVHPGVRGQQGCPRRGRLQRARGPGGNTVGIMALRPDSVSAAVANAQSVTGRDLAICGASRLARSGPGTSAHRVTLRRSSAADSWRSRAGSSLHSRSAFSTDSTNVKSREVLAMIAKLPDLAAIAAANAKRDAAIEEQQRQWLAKRSQR